MIKVYSPLGDSAGITGIGYVYRIGVESIWGFLYSVALLAFVLDEAEWLVKISVYKTRSLVCYL